MTEPDEYRSFADVELDTQNMEAVVANTDQEVDVDQAIRHQLYIGWVMGIAHAQSIGFKHTGGNRITVEGVPGVVLVIPYPSSDWTP